MILSFLALAVEGWGATLTWDGGGGDGLWSTATNWDTDTAPASGDTVHIDGPVTVSLTADATVASVVFNYSNDSAVVFNLAGHALTVSGSLNFGRSSGDLTNASNVTINGTGSITAASLDANQARTNTIVLNNTVNISVSGTFWGDQSPGTGTQFSGDGTSTVTASTLGGSGTAISFSGVVVSTGGNTFTGVSVSPSPAPNTMVTVTVSGTFAAGLQFRYTAARTDAGGTNEVYTLYDKNSSSSGSLVTITTATNLPLTSDANSYQFKIQYPAIIDSGDGLSVYVLSPNGFVLGTVALTQASAPAWDGDTSTDWSNAANWTTGAVPTTSSVVSIPAGTTYSPVLSAAVSVASLTVASGATLDLNGRDLSAATSITNNGTIRLLGTEVIAGTKVNGPSSVVDYHGGSVTPNWGPTYQNLLITSGTLTLSAATTVVSGLITNLAAVDLGNKTLSVGTVANSGTFTTAGGTLTVTGAGGTLPALTIATSATLNGGAGLTVSTTYTSSPALTTTGVVTVSRGALGALKVTSGSLTLTGGAASTTATSLTVTAGSLTTVGDLTVSGALSLGGTLNGGTGSLSFAAVTGAGTLNASTGTTTISGGMSGVTFVPNGGTVTLTGGSVAAYSFQTLNVAGAVTATGAWSVAGNVTISGGGTWNAGTFTHQIGGNWTNGGTFTAGSSTIAFTGAGTHVLSGATTFANLSDTVAGSTLTLTAGQSFGVSGTLTLTGAAGNPISVQSTTAATAALANTGAQSVTRVQVSHVTAGAAGITAAHSVDLTGDNTNWVFSAINWLTTGTSDANLGSNWSSGVVPGTYDAATVPSGGVQPVQTAGLSVRALTVQAGATWANAGFNLTVTGTGLSNAGTFTASGGTVSGWPATAGGTVVYALGTTAPMGPTGYTNLSVTGGTLTLGSVAVSGAYVQSGGTVTVPNGVTLTLNGATNTVTGGLLTIAAGGTVQAGSNSLSFGGTADLATSGTLVAGALTFAGSGSWTNTNSSTSSSGTVSLSSYASPGGSTLTLTGAGTSLTVPAGGVGHLTVNAPGTVTLSGGLTVAGALTVTSGTLAAGGSSVSFDTLAGAGTLSIASGTLTATGNGGTIKTLAVTTGATLNGGSGTSGIVVTDPTTGNLTTTGKVTLGGTLGAVSATGTLTLNSNSTATTLSLSGTPTFSQAGFTLGLTTLNLGSGGAVVFTNNAALTVSGITTVNVGTANDVSLANGANNFGTVAASTVANLTLVDATALTLGASTVSGNLSATAVGLAQSGAVVVAGTTNLQAGAGTLLLTNGSNDFGGAVSLGNSGNNAVALTDLDDLTLGAVALGTSTFQVASVGLTTVALPVTGATTLNYGTGALTTGAVTGTSANLSLVGSGGATLASAALGTGVLNLAGVTGTPVVTVTGGLTAGGLTAPSSDVAFDLALLGGGTVTAATDLTHQTGTLTVGDGPSDVFAFTGGLTKTVGPKVVAGTLSAAGTAALNLGGGATSVTADATLGGSSTGTLTLGAVTLADGVTLTLGAGAATPVATGTISGTPAGAPSHLTVNVADSVALPAVTLGTIGTDVGTVTVTQSSGVAFGTVSAQALALTDTRNGSVIAFSGNLSVTTTVTTGTGAFGVTLGGTTNTLPGTTFSLTGPLSLGTAGGTTTFATGVAATAPSSQTLAGTITATSGSLSLGGAATTLAADTTLDAQVGAGAVTLASVSGTGRVLTLHGGTGASQVSGIGLAGARLASVTADVTPGGTLALGSIYTTGAQTLGTVGATLSLAGAYDTSLASGTGFAAAGTVVLGASSTLTTAGANATSTGTLDAAVAGAQNLGLALGTGAWTPGGAWGATKSLGTLTLTSGTVSPPGLTASTLTLNGGTLSPSGTLTVTTATTIAGATLALSSGYAGSGATFALNAGTVTVATAAFQAGALTQSAGTFTQTGDNGGNLQALGSLGLTGGTMNWDNADAGGTLAIAGALANAGGTLGFHNKVVSLGTSVSGTFTVLDLTIPSGTTLTPAAGASITVRRHLSIQSGGTYSAVNGPGLTLGGASGLAGNLADANAVPNNLGAVTVSSVTKTATTALRFGSLDLVSGAQLSTGFNLTVDGALTSSVGSGTLVATGSPVLTVGSHFTPTVFTRGVGDTVVLSATTSGNATLGAHTFTNLTMSKALEAHQVSPAGAVTVAGVLTLTQGTWNAGATTLTVAGNWDSSNTNVTFTAGTGTVVLSGTPTVTQGTDNFRNLTFQQGGTLATNLTTTGNLVVGSVTPGTLGGAVTHSLTVGGTTTVTAGANPITWTNASNHFTGAVSLANTGANDATVVDAATLTLATVALGQNLTVTAAAVVLTGNVTTGGTQTWNPSVTLGATVNLTGAVTFLSPVVGGGNGLTVTGNAVFGNAGADTVTGLSSLTVTGTSQINTTTVTATTQSYGGTATLGATANLTGAVTFLSPVVGAANGLTVTGNAVFGDAGADTVTGLSSLTVTGTSQINTTTVTTTGGQSYQGAVTLGASTTLTGAPIQVQSTLGGAFNLTLGTGSGAVTFTGAVTSLGTGAGSALTAAAGVGPVTFQSSLTAANGLTVGAGVNITFASDVSVSGVSATTFAAASSVNFTGATPQAFGSNGDVTFSGTVTGGSGLLTLGPQTPAVLKTVSVPGTLNVGSGGVRVVGNFASSGTVVGLGGVDLTFSTPTGSDTTVTWGTYTPSLGRTVFDAGAAGRTIALNPNGQAVDEVLVGNAIATVVTMADGHLVVRANRTLEVSNGSSFLFRSTGAYVATKYGVELQADARVLVQTSGVFRAYEPSGTSEVFVWGSGVTRGQLENRNPTTGAFLFPVDSSPGLGLASVIVLGTSPLVRLPLAGQTLFLEDDAVRLGSLQADAGTTVDFRGLWTSTDAHDLEVTGGWTLATGASLANTTTTVPVTASTTTFTNTAAASVTVATTASTQQFYHLVLAGTGVLTLGGPVAVAGTFTQNSGARFDLGGQTLLVAGNVTVNATTAADFVVAGSTVSLEGAATVGSTQPFYNLFLNAPGSTVVAGTALTVTNRFAAFRGTWDANSRGLAVGEDFVAYGPAYQSYLVAGVTYHPADDGERAASRVNTAFQNRLGYPYWGTLASAYSALASAAFGAGHAVWGAVVGAYASGGYQNVLPDVMTAQMTFDGGETLAVGRNFYVHGASLVGAASWNLSLVPKWTAVKLNAAEATDWFGRPFAVAVATGSGMQVTNAQASQVVAAAHTAVAGSSTAGNTGTPPTWTSAVGLTGTTNWDNTRADVDTRTAFLPRTRFDDLVEVTFTKALRNDDGEVGAAVASSATASPDFVRFGSGTVNAGSSFDFFEGTPGATGGYGAGEYSTQAASNDDKATLSFRTYGVARWNTDATGASSGDPGSSDRYGTNQTLVPNLTFEKARLYDASGNPVVNRDGVNRNGTVLSSRVTSVLDFARPVLVRVVTGQAAKHFPPTTPQDGHNYWSLTWSEPVNLGHVSLGTDNAVGTAPNAASEVEANPTALLTFGDSYSAVPGTVLVPGLFDYAGTLYRSTRAADDVGAQTNQAQANKVTNTFYRGSAQTLTVYLAGASTGTGTSQYWDGFWWGATEPAGAVYTVPSTYATAVTDLGGLSVETANILWPSAGTDPKVGATIAAQGATTGLTWELEAPRFAGFTGDASGSYEVVALDTNTNDAVDQVQFHVLSNVVLSGQSWDSTTGHLPVNRLNSALYGVRDSSLVELHRGLSLSIDNSTFLSTPLTVAADASAPYVDNTGVDNLLFNGGPLPLTGFGVSDDGYFSLQLAPGLVPATWKPSVQYYVKYDPLLGRVTNLAGRLVEPPVDASTSFKAVDRTAPSLSLSLAGKDLKKVYLQFSRHVAATDPSSDPTYKNVFFLRNADGTPAASNAIDSLEFLDGPANNFQQAFVHLSQPLAAADVLGLRLQASSASAVGISPNYLDPTQLLPLASIGLDVVVPVWASDGTGGEANQSGTDHVVHDFTGREFLTARDIEVQAKVFGGAGLAGLPLRLFYDFQVPSTHKAGDLWLPSGFFTHVDPKLVPLLGNSAARYLDPRKKNAAGDLKNFIVPGTDSEMINGSQLEFLFQLGSLFVVRAVDPQDPRQMAPWRIPLKGIRTQKNGVTILNNVIDPTQGQKTQILYTTTRSGVVTAQVFALDGSLVRVLQRGRQASGDYSLSWDGRNASGDVVARGVYFIRVVAPDIDETRNVMIIK